MMTILRSFRLNLSTSFPADLTPSSIAEAILSPKPPFLGLETMDTTAMVSL